MTWYAALKDAKGRAFLADFISSYITNIFFYLFATGITVVGATSLPAGGALSKEGLPAVSQWCRTL